MGVFSFLFGRPKPQTVAQSRIESRPATLSSGQHARIKWREDAFPMQVVGESNYQDALVAICGRHTRNGHEGQYEALVEREPSNHHDPNAVMVKIQGRKVGYLPREQAERVSEQMRHAGLVAAVCLARVRGGWRTNQYDEGHYGIGLAIPNHGWIDFGIGAQPQFPDRYCDPPPFAWNPRRRVRYTASGSRSWAVPLTER